MEIALFSKLKLDFVDGSNLKPIPGSPLLPYWNQCNHMIISWLLNSVSADIRNNIVYMDSALSIWKELVIRYAQSNLPKLFDPRKEITQLSQGSMSIFTYYTKYKTLIDELDSLSSKPKCDCNKCTCEINSKMHLYDFNIQLMQFLMGLNDSFTSIRGQILLMTHIPTLSQCYAMLLQDENQRDVIHVSAMNSSNIALNVRSALGKSIPKGTYGTQRGNSTQSGFTKKTVNDPSLLCDFCHMQGHTRDNCFCVVGYPAWHRLYGKPKPKPRFSTPKGATAA